VQPEDSLCKAIIVSGRHPGIMKRAAKKTAPAKARAKRAPEPDVNQVANAQIRKLTGERTEPIPTLIAIPKPTQAEISRVMAELRRRGGTFGGKRRAEHLTEAERDKRRH
jgi:hypothetical protein